MDELARFLRAAKQAGASDSFLVELLKQQGWPARTVYEALGAWYAETTGVPMPTPRSTLEAAREAFYHLLAFGTLGGWICAIGSIWFTMIDYWVPDALDRPTKAWALRQVSWQIAAIVVAFPVFVVATRSILGDLSANPDKTASPVRRWLTNIALLITATVFIGDLVAVLAVFLEGELTRRFLAKSLVVLGLAGAVFAYYTRGMGKENALAKTWHTRFAALAAALIAATLVAGFSYTGSPDRQRILAEDRRRSQDINSLARRIYEDYTAWPLVADRKLPADLSALRENSAGRIVRSTDPVTNEPYGYEPEPTGSKYKLCATFGAPSLSGQRPMGRHCFSFDATKAPAYDEFE
jgi:hypothetical protein